jgi:2-C-methyl-D-erythritol 4-phosphate cytidylyltransferase
LPAVSPKRIPAVKKTLPREIVFLAQTPQAFRRDVLARAIELGQRGTEATDEAYLAEQIGATVLLVPGEATNLKITTAADLAFARGLLLDRGDA